MSLLDWTLSRQKLFKTNHIPGPPKVCFMKVFRYIKPTKRHGTFGSLGIEIIEILRSVGSKRSFTSAQKEAMGQNHSIAAQ